MRRRPCLIYELKMCVTGADAFSTRAPGYGSITRIVVLARKTRI